MRLLRIPRAADELGITRQRLWKLVSKGTITAMEIDGEKFIDMDTVNYTRQHDRKAGGRGKRK